MTLWAVYSDVEATCEQLGKKIRANRRIAGGLSASRHYRLRRSKEVGSRLSPTQPPKAANLSPINAVQILPAAGRVPINFTFNLRNAIVSLPHELDAAFTRETANILLSTEFCITADSVEAWVRGETWTTHQMVPAQSPVLSRQQAITRGPLNLNQQPSRLRCGKQDELSILRVQARRGRASTMTTRQIRLHTMKPSQGTSLTLPQGM
jgi:hypothetical protein